MKVIGIDPGTISVGFGVVEDVKGKLVYRDSGTVSCKNEDDLAKRLVAIHQALQVVIREWQPDYAAIETVFFGKNVNSAIKIGEGRGVALLSAAEAEVEIVGYEPTTVKKSVCGNGRAGKEQIAQMVKVLLGLKKAPDTDHESDALAMAICHINRAKRGLSGNSKSDLPPAVLKALGGKAPPKRRKKVSAKPRLRK
ncbi:MAG: crossover junction endodeoxyribonuclease RuvC [Planctomycetota bacterium]|jgi:crossover junction endodeoxyribonuclease RuvC